MKDEEGREKDGRPRMRKKMKDELSEGQAGQDDLMIARMTSSNVVSNDGDMFAC